MAKGCPLTSSHFLLTGWLGLIKTNAKFTQFPPQQSWSPEGQAVTEEIGSPTHHTRLSKMHLPGELWWIDIHMLSLKVNQLESTKLSLSRDQKWSVLPFLSSLYYRLFIGLCHTLGFSEDGSNHQQEVGHKESSIFTVFPHNQLSKSTPPPSNFTTD